MKTLQTSAIALMISLVSISSLQAQDNTMQLADQPSVSTADAPAHKTFDISLYRVQQSMSVCLSVEKALGEKVQVRLLDEKGEEFYQELLGRHTGKYARRFELSSLTDGSYTIEVRNGAEVMRRVVNLKTSQPVQNSNRTLVALN